jgi:hypothetical protein
MDYSQHMLARAEHDRMVKSLPTIPEYGYHLRERKSGTGYRPLVWVRAIVITILNFVIK